MIRMKVTEKLGLEKWARWLSPSRLLFIGSDGRSSLGYHEKERSSKMGRGVRIERTENTQSLASQKNREIGRYEEKQRNRSTTREDLETAAVNKGVPFF